MIITDLYNRHVFFVYIRLANFHILLCKKMHNNQQMKCDSANPIYSYYHLLTDIDIINE